MVQINLINFVTVGLMATVFFAAAEAVKSHLQKRNEQAAND